MEEQLTLKKFEEASEIVKKVTLNTNLIYSDYFSSQTDNQVYIKPENMQFTGAYKVRGSYYKISTLSEAERLPLRREITRRESLMRQNLRSESHHCHADRHPADESKPYKELRC